MSEAKKNLIEMQEILLDELSRLQLSQFPGSNQRKVILDEYEDKKSCLLNDLKMINCQLKELNSDYT